MAEEKSDKGFTVVDRRIQADEESEGNGKAEAQGKKEAPGGEERAGASDAACPDPVEAAKAQEPRPPLPPVSFPTFLLSLHTSALIHLGIIPDPISEKCEVSLEIARQNIDLLEILKTKTEGNLTPEEAKLMENILYELRIAYINISGEKEKGEKSK